MTLRIRKIDIKCNDNLSMPNIFLCASNHRHVGFTFNDDELDFITEVIAKYKEGLIEFIQSDESKNDDEGKGKGKDKEECIECVKKSIEMADHVLNRFNFSDDMCYTLSFMF